jgi:dihydrofolate reductase
MVEHTSSPVKMAVIAAMDRNGVIGKDNQLLWHLPDDMAHFKSVTAHHAVIMGSRTYESLPPRFRPLPNRFNIVLSRTQDHDPTEHCVWVNDTAEAYRLADAYARQKQQNIYFVIGGGVLYAQALSSADILYITHIDEDYAGDAFFPTFDASQWQSTTLGHYESQNGQPAFTIVRYDRML